MDLTPYKMRVILNKHSREIPSSSTPYGVVGIALRAVPLNNKAHDRLLFENKEGLLKALFNPNRGNVRMQIVVRWSNDIRGAIWSGDLALISTNIPICNDIWNPHGSKILWATEEDFIKPPKTVTPEGLAYLLRGAGDFVYDADGIQYITYEFDGEKITMNSKGQEVTLDDKGREVIVSENSFLQDIPSSPTEHTQPEEATPDDQWPPPKQKTPDHWEIPETATVDVTEIGGAQKMINPCSEPPKRHKSYQEIANKYRKFVSTYYTQHELDKIREAAEQISEDPREEMSAKDLVNKFIADGSNYLSNNTRPGNKVESANINNYPTTNGHTIGKDAKLHKELARERERKVEARFKLSKLALENTVESTGSGTTYEDAGTIDDDGIARSTMGNATSEDGGTDDGDTGGGGTTSEERRTGGGNTTSDTTTNRWQYDTKLF